MIAAGEVRSIFAGDASKCLSERFRNEGPCRAAQANTVTGTTCWYAAIFLVLLRVRHDPADLATRLLFDLLWLVKEQRISGNYTIHDLKGRVPDFDLRRNSFAVCRVRG
jgi:hypothetical protein